jgi:UDP-galactopyranose mutase
MASRPKVHAAIVICHPSRYATASLRKGQGSGCAANCRPADKAKYDAYRAMAEADEDVIFGGQLRTYRYLDMHQAMGAALRIFEARLQPYFRKHRPLKAPQPE